MKRINRIYVKNESGETFIIDSGEKSRWNTSFDNISESREVVSERMFKLLDKHGSLYFPIAFEREIQQEVENHIEPDLVYSKEILVKMEKDFSIVRLIQNIKNVLSEKKDFRSNFESTLFSFIRIKAESDRDFRKKIINDLMVNFLPKAREMTASNSAELNEIFKKNFNHSSLETIINNVVDKEIASLVANFESNNSLLFISSVNKTVPFFEKVKENYSYIRDLIDLRLSFDSSGIFERGQKSNIQSLILYTALNFTKEIEQDSYFRKKIKANSDVLKYAMVNESFDNFFEISKISKKEMEIFTNFSIDSFNQLGSLFLLELFNKGMGKKALEFMSSRQEKEQLHRSLISLLEFVIGGSGDRDNSTFILDLYMDSFLSIKREIFKNLNENNLNEIIALIKKVSSSTNKNIEESFSLFFGDEGEIDRMDFIKDASTKEKKILLKMKLDLYSGNNYIEKSHSSIFTKTETQNMRYSGINSVFVRFYALTKTFENEYESLSDEEVKKIYNTFFRYLASSNANERKSLTRMLSLYLHLKYYDVPSELSSPELLDKRIKILIKELSNSTLRNSTVASIINNPSVLYGDISFYRNVTRLTGDTIMGKDYSYVSILIENDEDIRMSIKSALLLNILN
jgi:hypothetical protein